MTLRTVPHSTIDHPAAVDEITPNGRSGADLLVDLNDPTASLTLEEVRRIRGNDYTERAAGPAEPDATSALPRWRPTNLGGLVRDGIEPDVPTVLEMTDGGGLFYPGMVNGLHGPSGDGKGWVATHAVCQVVGAGGSAAIIDYEDTARSWATRLTQLGMTSEELGGVAYYAADAPIPSELVESLGHHELVVIDSVGEALAIGGSDPNRDHEVAAWFRRVPRRIASSGPTVLVIDHTTKVNRNDLWPAGSHRKRAAISGAAFVTRVRTAFQRGHGGRVSLVCAKDRHGTYRQGETVGNLVMDDAGRITLHPANEPSTAEWDGTTARLCDQAVAVLEERGEPLSQRGLCGALRGCGVKASNDTIRAALDLAISEGRLDEKIGPRNARMLSAPDRAATAPDAVEDLVPDDRATAPVPKEGAVARSGPSSPRHIASDDRSGRSEDVLG